MQTRLTSLYSVHTMSRFTEILFSKRRIVITNIFFSLDKGGTGWSVAHVIWVGIILLVAGIDKTVIKITLINFELQPKTHISIITIQNGVEWNPENRNGQFYTTLEPYTDIPQHRVVSKTSRIKSIKLSHCVYIQVNTQNIHFSKEDSGSIYVCTADVTFGFQSTTAKSIIQGKIKAFLLIIIIRFSSFPKSKFGLFWLLQLV